MFSYSSPISKIHGPIVGLFVLFSIFSTSAQDIEVSPVIVEFKPSIDGIQEREITITNHTDAPMVYIVKEYDLYMTKDGTRASAEYGTTAGSLKGLLNVTPSTLELQANEKGIVKAQFLGSDYSKFRLAKLNISAQKESSIFSEVEKLGTGINIVPSISVLVLQHSDANAPVQTSVGNLMADANNRGQYHVSIDNNGETMIKGKLMFLITDINTGEEKTLQTQNVNLLPGGSKKYSILIDQGEIGSNKLLSAILDSGPKQELKGSQIELK